MKSHKAPTEAQKSKKCQAGQTKGLLFSQRNSNTRGKNHGQIHIRQVKTCEKYFKTKTVLGLFSFIEAFRYSSELCLGGEKKGQCMKCRCASWIQVILSFIGSGFPSKAHDHLKFFTAKTLLLLKPF